MSDNKADASFKSMIRVNSFFMRFAGLLKLEGRNVNSIETTLLLLHSHILQLFIISMFASTVAKETTSGNINFETVAGCVGLSGVYLRFVICCYNRDRIEKLFQESHNLWTELKDTEIPNIRKSIRPISKLSAWYVGLNLCWSCLYILICLLHGTLNNSKENVKRMLPFSFVIDIQDSLFYEIMLSLQSFFSLGFSLLMGSSDMICPFFIIMASGHFEILCSRFNEMGREYPFVKRGQTLKNMISSLAYHQKINTFCNEIDKLSKLIFSIQLLSSTYNLALIGLAMVSIDQNILKLLPIFGVVTIQLFLCNYTADVLKTESNHITESMYIVPSITQKDTKLSQIITIVLIRSQNPMQLTAGGCINMSIECFKSMMSSAISFFIVIRELT